MNKIRTILLFVLATFLACGCATATKSPNFRTLEVSFAWEGNAGSLRSPNPRITVSKVPAGTAFLEVRMKDLNNPHNHGGGIVAHDGSGVIPVGALRNYDGPQPPAGQVHTYVFTVTALNADKLKFPSSYSYVSSGFLSRMP